ncbi:MAG: MBL fold metallo-hydrolase [Gemmatimonadaceae bacterium]|nr:MBL fold metallo-hydrolase [Gemmatimonadaceae bacterium]
MSFPGPLVESRHVGRWRVHAIQAGGQQLDGGAMFGVVPKVLWSRRLPADERNRIPMGMRCLLVEHPDGLVLIDSGAGDKEDARFYDIYGIEQEPEGCEPGEIALHAALRTLGVTAHDVRWVINTHLHFDHAGGNTRRTPDGAAAAFPAATYVVQRGEYEYATHTNERTAASYFRANFEPIARAERWRLVEGEVEVVPGIRVRPTPGHTPFHQSVLLRDGGETLCFLGDVVPTAHHLPLPWIMGYDVEPLVTLESKRTLLAEAEAEQWTLVFEHDAHTAFGQIRHDGKAYTLR